MSSEYDLTFWANLSSVGAFIVTTIGMIVGVRGYCKYRLEWRKKRKALEEYLKKKKNSVSNDKKGQQTIKHLIRHVGLTEDEILKISFESNLIERKVISNKDGFSEELLFEYFDKSR